MMTATDPKQPLILMSKSLAALLLLSLCPAAVGQVSDTEDFQNKYFALRSKANAGGATEKFDAFVYVYENTSKLQEHVSEALDFLVDAAKAGHVHAQYDLGFLYATGRWVERDADEALPWLIKAAENGHRRAHLWAGITFLSKFYDAPDEASQDDILQEIEHWLGALIELEGDESRLSFAAKEVLARAWLSQNIANREAWALLRDLKSAAYDPGLKTISTTEQILIEQSANGREDATVLLEEFRRFMSEIP